MEVVDLFKLYVEHQIMRNISLRARRSVTRWRSTVSYTHLDVYKRQTIVISTRLFMLSTAAIRFCDSCLYINRFPLVLFYLCTFSVVFLSKT